MPSKAQIRLVFAAALTLFGLIYIRNTFLELPAARDAVRKDVIADKPDVSFPTINTTPPDTSKITEPVTQVPPIKHKLEVIELSNKPNINAAIVSLIRNSELDAMLDALKMFEERFNKRFGYPYVFLNDQAFTAEFKRKITAALPDRKVEFGLLPKEHWSYPEWINQTYAAECRQRMKDIIYGSSESYRHMCRYQSGFFFRHPLMLEYDYYWRVEPGVRFTCDIVDDPFQQMVERNAKYGFTVAIHEYKETIPTLWKTTLEFMDAWKKMHPTFNPELLRFFGNEGQDGYNLCHYWSNFEIGSIKWLNSDEYLSYFNYLDQAGGFFYERWGDAPVHSIAVGLFLKKEEVIFFDKIGYFHNPFSHCPIEPFHSQLNCECKIEDAITEHGYSCVPQWREYNNTSWYRK